MKKLFISQPMNGKDKQDILATRERAIKKAMKVLGEDVVLIDSYVRETPPEGNKIALWYLGKAISLLSEADVAYFAEGWENARGCKIEHTCAIEYGCDVIEE